MRSAPNPEAAALQYRSQPKAKQEALERVETGENKNTYDDLGISDEEESGADHQARQLASNRVELNFHEMNDF
jgi:Fe-S cluster assembly scaffold protein SufB